MLPARRGHIRRQASVDYPRYPPLNSTTQQPPPSDMLSQPIASDYESDTQGGGYVSDYPTTAPPPRTREELNLSVIQKHYPQVTAILSVVPYATIYDFAPATNEWQKSGLVGTLFICQLSPGEYGEERYHGLVLNRGGLDNFDFELMQTDRTGVEVTGDFVQITRDIAEETKLNAIYIYSEQGTSTAASRAANGELMVQLAVIAARSRAVAQARAHAQAQTQIQTQIQPHAHAHAHAHTHAQPYPHVNQNFESDTASTPSIPHPRPHPHPQPSPAPQIAPVPSRQVDLLALLQGGNHSDVESFATKPSPTPSGQMNQPNVVHDLFRKAGLA